MKTLYVTILVSIYLVLLGISMDSSQAATSGTLYLKGVIPEVISIVVTPEGVATNLDLEVDQTNLKVGAVTEKSNSDVGYKIQMSSANNGNLEHSSATVIPYTVNYSGSNYSLTTTPQVVKTVNTGGVYNVEEDLNISYTGIDFESKPSGDYEDTITVSIEVN